jgi:hydrogenase expression/formation protein HypC
MCLAVPGKILVILEEGELSRSGRVDFGGMIREVSLALVPEALPGDYVLVHAGMALSRLEEAEALKTLEDLRRIGELG